jgi:hypothetical protein
MESKFTTRIIAGFHQELENVLFAGTLLLKLTAMEY